MDVPAPPVVPFLASLEGGHREAIVRQSADPTITTPEPVDADKLYLSSIGAWLDLHGRWDDEPYINAGADPVLLAWDHEATTGRDNYVRVVEPYYLFPFGHLANLVTITERKIIDVHDPQARLYQRKFLTLREPVRTYDDRRMPFKQVRIRPLVTPNLDVSPVLTAIGLHRRRGLLADDRRQEVRVRARLPRPRRPTRRRVGGPPGSVAHHPVGGVRRGRERDTRPPPTGQSIPRPGSRSRWL